MKKAEILINYNFPTNCPNCGKDFEIKNDEKRRLCSICTRGEYVVNQGTNSGEGDVIRQNNIVLESDDKQYRKDSIVSKHKDIIDEMVSAHWNYVKCVIESGADVNKMFTFDEVMKIRRWDYCSAARHFYGHGYEDGQTNIDIQ